MKTITKLKNIVTHPCYHRFLPLGLCNICRRRTVFLCDDPADRWIRRCVFCRSTPKYRAIAQAAEGALGTDLDQFVLNHQVYELTTTSPLFRRYHGNRHYVASGYFFDKPFGKELRPGVWNQDVQRLSFSDESFDLVITSETMEHVRRPWSGFAEIHRVLKPGGLHVFTIPYQPDRVTTRRVDTTGDEDVYLMPKVYHRDPYRTEDSLVYTDYGTDLVELLTPLGFVTEEHLIHDQRTDTHDDLRPVRVFVSRKMADRS